MTSKLTIIILTLFLLPFSSLTMAEKTDPRTFVEMPPEMQQKFLSKMRGHLITLDAIIAALADEDLEKAADIAENQLGMWHGKGKGKGQNKQHECDEAKHKDHDHKGQGKEKGKGFGKMMPPEMKAMGRQLHKAASNFAAVAKEGDERESLKALQKISAACVACHQTYRVR